MTAVDDTRSRAGNAGPRPQPSWTGRLVVVHPRALAGAHSLASTTTIVGRSPDAGADGLRIDDPTVSRRHLGVRWEPELGRHRVADLGSRNGSALAGHPLGQTARPLEHGQVIRIGDVLAVYEHVDPSLHDPPAVARDAVPGTSAAIVTLRAALARAAVDRAPALIVGETGTGKERVAAELHRLGGRTGPYIAVNCAALSPQLIESQLFGHARGAFTGATAASPGLFRGAHGGTLFLDEIGELPRELQAKLLRAIEYGEVMAVGDTQVTRVEVRIVAATNRDLAAEVERGEFRRDLHARLALWDLHVPPLRSRRADVLAWHDRLHAIWAAQRGQPSTPPIVAAAFAEAMLLHAWPDNLRGLVRLIHETSRTTRPGDVLTVLPAWLPAVQPEPAPAPTPAATPAVLGPRSRPSREALIAALADNGWSVRATARHFGRDRKQIARWIEAYQVALPQRSDD